MCNNATFIQQCACITRRLCNFGFLTPTALQLYIHTSQKRTSLQKGATLFTHFAKAHNFTNTHFATLQFYICNFTHFIKRTNYKHTLCTFAILHMQLCTLYNLAYTHTTQIQLSKHISPYWSRVWWRHHVSLSRFMIGQKEVACWDTCITGELNAFPRCTYAMRSIYIYHNYKNTHTHAQTSVRSPLKY